MNTSEILSKAWGYMRRYRALWVFGVLLALTTASWVTGWGWTGSWNRSNGTLVQGRLSATDLSWIEQNLGISVPPGLNLHWSDLTFREGSFLQTNLPPVTYQTLLTIALTLVIAVLVVAIIGLVIRYVSETALIKMVNDHEETRQKHTVRQGLRLGWSHAAWRLFFIDVTIALLTVVVVIALFLPALFVVMAFIAGNERTVLLGAFLAAIVTFPAIAIDVVVVAFALLLSRLSHQVCVVDEVGVFDAVRRTFRVVRQNFKAVLPIWLVMIGVDLIYPLLIAPIAIVVVGVGLALAGLITLGVAGAAQASLAVIPAWIVAAAIGIFCFALIVAVPLVFLGGLREVFQSSAWTLAYRELRAMKDVKRAPVSTTLPAPA